MERTFDVYADPRNSEARSPTPEVVKPKGEVPCPCVRWLAGGVPAGLSMPCDVAAARAAALAIAPSERAASLDVTTSRDGLAQALATLTARVAGQCRRRSGGRGAGRRVDAAGARDRRRDVAAPRGSGLIRTIAATDSYLARRMLGAVYLAQHRFLEALAAGAGRTGASPGRLLELRRHRRRGHRAGPVRRGVCGVRSHGGAQAVGRLRTPASRTRASCRAICRRRSTAMRMAIEATSPQDAGGRRVGMVAARRAASAAGRDRRRVAGPTTGRCSRFRGIRTRCNGRARVAVARGDLAGAIAIYRELLAQDADAGTGRADRRPPRRDGRCRRRAGRHGPRPSASNARAGSTRRRSRRRWRDCWRSGLCRPEVAVRLAREAARERDDIFTNDALAWSLYRTGALRRGVDGVRARAPHRHEATAASCITRRPSPRRAATRQRRALAAPALEGHPEFDLIAAPAARALLARNSLRASALSLQ